MLMDLEKKSPINGNPYDLKYGTKWNYSRCIIAFK